VRNAMTVHAAFGGSTNLLLHVPAVAHAAGLRRPVLEDWREVNRRTPRLVSVLPNGPVHHATVRVFLAGGVPEVMVHLRRLGLLETDVLTVSGVTLGEVLDEWEGSERRRVFREKLRELDGIDPDDVILPPERARAAGLKGTAAFPSGNLAPDGAVIKSTSIDPTVLSGDGHYRHEGPARVFASETEAMRAIKEGRIVEGDVLVLAGCGPMGTGMEETYQLTSALKHLPFGKRVALLTDARFSGVSTGACVGHIGPEALAGGPIGKLRDGDRIRLFIDREAMSGAIDCVGTAGRGMTVEEAAEMLAGRERHPELAAHPELPEDTKLWAVLQAASGGTWGGCVYDAEAIAARLGGGR
jgi:putative YjhG/YagF family dehydratase